MDAQIGGYSTSAASLCYEHLSKVKEDDLLVFDRYYASRNLMWSIKNKNADFLFRMKDNWCNVVDEFQKEKAKDKIIILETDYGSIKVRLIKSGNRVFCTSVLNKKIKPSDFNDLYDNRWGVEEAYKTLKNWCEIETFSGKTALAIKQDFYSKIFLMNLSAAFTHPVEEQIKKEKENYKVNRVQALASISQLPIALFLKKTGSKAIKAFDNIVSKTIDIIRKGRRNPRKIRPKKKHSMSYKKI
ncbi:MAG: transposase [Sporocytophaga sp.]|nr:transposase [Sporocytophaga sp.]